MLMPDKHIKISESIFGLSSQLLLLLIDKPCTVEKLWVCFKGINNTKKFPAYHSFDSFVIALDFLYLMNIIKESERGVLEVETH